MQDTTIRQRLRRAREGQSRLHGFIPPEFAAVSFPAARTDARSWTRINGDYSVTITPGTITEPEGHITELPSGKYARAALLYLCTRAKLTGENPIDVGSSYRSFIDQMGLPWQGSKRSGEALRQLLLLTAAAVRISQHYVDADGELCSWDRRHVVAEETILWTDLARTETSTTKDSSVYLSAGFLEMLDRAVPISMPAWKWLLTHSRSPMALDIYLWLCVRLPRCETTSRVTWAQLHQQFGATVPLPRFKQLFRRSLDVALQAYPTARIRESVGEHRRRGFKGYWLSASPDPRDVKLPESQETPADR